MKQHTRKTSGAGFTLVEVLVTLVVLSVGLIPVFIQASAALNLASSSRNKLIANYLAQEGIEVMHAIRDDNWFHRNGAGNSDRAFDFGFTECKNGTGCRVQWDSSSPIPLGSNPVLNVNGGVYEYGGSGDKTPFQRGITIPDSNSHRLHVRSTVTWQERTGTKTLSLDYYLYDWLQE